MKSKLLYVCVALLAAMAGVLSMTSPVQAAQVVAFTSTPPPTADTAMAATVYLHALPADEMRLSVSAVPAAHAKPVSTTFTSASDTSRYIGGAEKAWSLRRST